MTDIKLVPASQLALASGKEKRPILGEFVGTPTGEAHTVPRNDGIQKHHSISVPIIGGLMFHVASYPVFILSNFSLFGPLCHGSIKKAKKLGWNS